MLTALPESISDRDLDSNGVYKFNKMVRLQYPDEIDDFKEGTQLIRASRYFHEGTLSDSIVIDLSQNFDIEAKIEKYEGNANVVIADPDVTAFEIKDNHDFIVIGCDGVFDKLSSKDAIHIAW